MEDSDLGQQKMRWVVPQIDRNKGEGFEQKTCWQVHDEARAAQWGLYQNRRSDTIVIYYRRCYPPCLGANKDQGRKKTQRIRLVEAGPVHYLGTRARQNHFSPATWVYGENAVRLLTQNPERCSQWV